VRFGFQSLRYFYQSASESMSEAGHSAKEAGVNAGPSYMLITELLLATITAKVKTALHDDKIAKRTIFM
jgi:hypothetical protein